MQLQGFNLMSSGRKQNQIQEATEVGQSGTGRACEKARGIRSKHMGGDIIINLYININFKKNHKDV